ncbi:MAG: SH3 domain-containing protein [Kiritimatiellaceae bacterium]|nr:SH3 domain-containing protein [Kiritimatiellaceae bacterium]
MKMLKFIIVLPLLFAPCVFATNLNETNASKASQSEIEYQNSDIFKKAQTAYNEGRYSEASLLYKKLLSHGVKNVEVEYNLANAYFKNTQLPEAVWHYRKAWYAKPRDPDIRANMHFAINAAGAIEPAMGLTEKLFSALSQNEWITGAIGAYFLLMLLLTLGVLIRPSRRSLFRLSLLPLAFIFLCAGGWHHWQQLIDLPEWVVVKTEATALYGPIKESKAHYKIPLAALVRQRSAETKGWVEIEYDGKKGWINKKYIHRVSP